jgi:hypothetical protein
MTAASEIRRAEPAAGRAFQGFTDQCPDCRRWQWEARKVVVYIGETGQTWL